MAINPPLESMRMVISISYAFGMIANVMSNIAFVPQIIKSYRRKRVDDISISMFLVLFTTQLCWIGYAVPLHAEQLWTSSLIEIVLLLPIFAMWIKYRQPRGLMNKQACNNAITTEFPKAVGEQT